MPNTRAVELKVEESPTGTARLEIVTEDGSGERFVIQVDGPRAEVRAEADFLAEQYELVPA